MDFAKKQKNYKSCKLTRQVIDSGIHPLNWFLDKDLPLGRGELWIRFIFRTKHCYNFCKLTRLPIESGIHPLNLFLYKYLPNGRRGEFGGASENQKKLQFF